MGKPGPKPKGKVRLVWSPEFAYAMGLMVTDGSVSKNGRHVVFVSKDREQLENFINALNIQVPISYTTSSYTGKKVSRVQFGDRLFCDFLIGIGIMPNKTKTINVVNIPQKYFVDFLRGHLDGDGCVYSYWDPRWKSSFMCYTTFVSASRNHVDWLQHEIYLLLGIKGHMSTTKKGTVYQLRYAKADSLKLWRNLYYKNALSLSRKRLKIEKIVRIISEQERASWQKYVQVS